MLLLAQLDRLNRHRALRVPPSAAALDCHGTDWTRSSSECEFSEAFAPASTACGTRVLAPDLEAPVVPQPAVCTDALEALDIFSEFDLDVAGEKMHVLPGLDILAAIEHPYGKPVTGGIFKDFGEAFLVLRVQLPGTHQGIEPGDPAGRPGIPAAYTLDLGECKEQEPEPVHVCVLDPDNMVEISVDHDKRRAVRDGHSHRGERNERKVEK